MCESPGDAARRLPQYDCHSWKIGCCTSCGFVFLLNPPRQDDLVDALAFEKTFQKRKEQRTSALRSCMAQVRTFLARFKRRDSSPSRRFFPSGRILDVGCGDGQRIQPPRIPYGIEISRHLFHAADRIMRERGGHCVHATGAAGMVQFERGFFDGVLMNSYLEHEVHVLPVLRGAHRCLKLHGRLYLRVPNYASVNRRVFGRSWCGFRYPDHVNYFTPESLRAAAAKAGFRTRILNRLRLPIDDNIHALLTKIGESDAPTSPCLPRGEIPD